MSCSNRCRQALYRERRNPSNRDDDIVKRLIEAAQDIARRSYVPPPPLFRRPEDFERAVDHVMYALKLTRKQFRRCIAVAHAEVKKLLAAVPSRVRSRARRRRITPRR